MHSISVPDQLLANSRIEFFCLFYCFFLWLDILCIIFILYVYLRMLISLIFTFRLSWPASNAYLKLIFKNTKNLITL